MVGVSSARRMTCCAGWLETDSGGLGLSEGSGCPLDDCTTRSGCGVCTGAVSETTERSSGEIAEACPATAHVG